jgi:1-acyl-sn-glycerol-3-phosphate acyltransferase
MDALAMLFSVKNQLVFMARSDIFKKFATILYFLKILPIYRIRDGIDTLKKNQAVFDKTVDVLNAYNGLVILPEGNHAGIHRLRPLKKGFARIAFQTEETGKVTEGIGVVPVGIDYDDYTHCRSRKIIVFGKPIPVADFLESYRENPAVGLNLLKNHLAGKMKKLIIDIETVEYYEIVSGDTLSGVAKKFYGKGSAYMRIFEANREVIKDPDKIYVGQKIRIPID